MATGALAFPIAVIFTYMTLMVIGAFVVGIVMRVRMGEAGAVEEGFMGVVHLCCLAAFVAAMVVGAIDLWRHVFA